MRNKAPLALMEQLVMILVFALAAVLCLQVFVVSDRLSRESEARDRAVTAAQNAAETLKSCAGDFERAASIRGRLENENWILDYDENWQPTEENAAYYVKVTPGDSGHELLGTAEITVHQEGKRESIFTLPVAWQEVDGDAGA